MCTEEKRVYQSIQVVVTLYEFNKLDLQERIKLTFDKAIFLHSCQWPGSFASLYFLDEFYVEVVLYAKTNKITEATPFTEGSRLDKYLDDLSIVKDGDDLKIQAEN